MTGFFISLLRKYRSIISYAFFGACTTLINVCSYYVCNSFLGFSNIPAVIIAWLTAVLFAFITNKLWVFGSKSFAKNIFTWEIVSFYICRMLTGMQDIAIMYIAVDMMQLNAVLWKALSNIISIIFNYIASRIVIFKASRNNP